VSAPKVFQPGALTLAITNDAVAVAVGAADVQFVRSVTIAWDAETKMTTAVVEFYQSHQAETALRIEEAKRQVRALGWAQVRG
jgi:hypothetical protein